MLRFSLISLFLIGSSGTALAQSSCEEGGAMLRPLWAQEKMFQKKQKCKDDNPFCLAGYPEDKLTDAEKIQREAVSKQISSILRFGNINNCNFINKMK